MINVYDMQNTLLLIFCLGLVLVAIQGRFRWICQDTSDAIQCDAMNPCSVGLKCINGFCAKTVRLTPHEKGPEAEAEEYASGPHALMI